MAELGKSRKPLTQNGLARRLKPLGIAPGNVGPEAARVRGYVRAHFKEAFERYLSAEGVTQPPIRPECDEISTSDISEVPSREDGCAVANEQKTQQPRASVQMGSCEGIPRRDPGGPGLSHRNILDLARWYIERAEAQRQDEGDVDSAVLDAELREVLAEMVLPELVEVEVERVMVEVFRV